MKEEIEMKEDLIGGITLVDKLPDNPNAGMLYVTSDSKLYMRTDNKITDFGSIAPTSHEYIDNNAMKEIIDRLRKEFGQKTITQCKCHNCGAALDVEYEKPVIKCNYCNSTFIIGPKRINDR